MHAQQVSGASCEPLVLLTCHRRVQPSANLIKIKSNQLDWQRIGILAFI